MTWLVLLVVLLMVVLTVAQVLERRPRRPSEEERQANRLRILEYRRARGDVDVLPLEGRQQKK